MFLLTAASSGRYADTGPITTVHLILIAVLIVLVIGAIIWGMRQKRVRVETDKIEAERAEQMLAHPQTETAASPAPPPLGDSGMNTAAAVAEPAKPEPAAKPAPKPRAAAKPKPAVSAATAKASAHKQAAPAPKKTAPAEPVAKPAPKGAAKPKAAAPAAKATATSRPAPAKAAAPKAAPAPATSYQLIDVKGLGPKAVPLLEGLGVRTLADLAKLSAARASEIDGQLGALSGRMARDRWIEQAKLLDAGKVAEFEAAFGKL